MINQLKRLFTNKIFLIGILIRFLLMPFFAHYDIRGINFAVYNLPFKQILNVYDVAATQPVDYIVEVNFGRDYFIYPPLTYFTLGSFMTLLKPLYGPEFVSWIQGFGTNVKAVLTDSHVFRYLFLMKIPYLVFDVGILLSIQSIFKSKKHKNKAMLLWWLNPISIYLVYLWGQFDLIPTLFTLLSVIQVAKNRPYRGALLMGIAASFKNYPLIFLPFLAVIAGKKFWKMIKIFATGLAPFILTTMPFWGNEFFRKTVLFSWQSQKLMDFLVSTGGNEGIYPFFIGYILLFMATLYGLKGRTDKLAIPIVLSLMWYYATVNFHTQWFMWVLPFLVILLVKKTKELAPIAWWVTGLFFFRLIEIQANATFELMAWINPAFTDLPKTRYILSLLYDINKLRNIVNSAYFATAIWFSWYVWSKTLTRKNKESLF